jgi:hypothetical protein
MIHDLSLGEVQSLALKAARGAGRSFGIAEEAGFAVRWLTERGVDGAGHLAALLVASDGAAEGCPLHLGAAWSDAGQVPEGAVSVICPMLLLPFLPGLCGAGGLAVSAEPAVARVSGAGDLAGDLPMARVAVRVLACETVRSGARHTRAKVDKAALAQLQDFAFRTYAPATEASRNSGAGAGLSDND